MFRLAFFLFLTTLMITKNVQSDPTVVSGKEITEDLINQKRFVIAMGVLLKERLFVIISGITTAPKYREMNGSVFFNQSIDSMKNGPILQQGNYMAESVAGQEIIFDYVGQSAAIICDYHRHCEVFSKVNEQQVAGNDIMEGISDHNCVYNSKLPRVDYQTITAEEPFVYYSYDAPHGESDDPPFTGSITQIFLAGKGTKGTDTNVCRLEGKSTDSRYFCIKGDAGAYYKEKNCGSSYANFTVTSGFVYNGIVHLILSDNGVEMFSIRQFNETGKFIALKKMEAKQFWNGWQPDNTDMPTVTQPRVLNETTNSKVTMLIIISVVVLVLLILILVCILFFCRKKNVEEKKHKKQKKKHRKPEKPRSKMSNVTQRSSQLAPGVALSANTSKFSSKQTQRSTQFEAAKALSANTSKLPSKMHTQRSGMSADNNSVAKLSKVKNSYNGSSLASKDKG